ncbi:MAG: alpha/beta fold hydrolase, partial [Actinomycetota bacterium]|nr:alpha/beta fold hydrolase [Actinomycetota bacterium]
MPWASVVRCCLDGGMLVHLAEWTPPGAPGQHLGLDAYADRLLLDCVDAVEARTGQPGAFLAGHSLGGTLAAIFAARHPCRVRGLVLVEAPLRFGRHAGAFAPLVAAAPDMERRRPSGEDVPGSFLSVTSSAAAPVTFHWERHADLLASLPSPRALETHLRVQRWTLDELPLPGRLFEEVVERLYREDRLMRGDLL